MCNKIYRNKRSEWKRLFLQFGPPQALQGGTKQELPDLMLGTWCIECKAYGAGAEPRPDWWDQVLASSSGQGLKPALVYKFNNRPIKVRVLANSINNKIKNNLVTVDLLWPDFIQIILELFQEDIELHEQNYQV